MNGPKPSSFRLALATARSAMGHFLAYSFLFVMVGTVAVGRALEYGWLEPFRVGNVEIPKFMGTLATNVTVAIFCGIGVISVAVAFGIRYFTYRSFLARARARGVTDIDNDGKPDVFTDRFLDDL